MNFIRTFIVLSVPFSIMSMEPVQIDEELAQGYVIPPSPLNFKEYDEDEQLVLK